VVEDLLERPHLGQERVEVRVRLAHEFGDLVEAVELRLDRPDALLNVAQDVLLLVQQRLLHEDADGVTRAQHRLPVGRLLEPGHDLENRGLACAVRPDDADLGPREERERHVVEDDLVAVRLARLMHLIDELSHWILRGRSR
jgi:hypothetical protein